jgi:hypothetical protein
MRLSPHFTLNELMRSQAAARHGIDNRPGAREIESLRELSSGILEPVRAYFGRPFSPSSGYRCARLNRLIGGAENSQHMFGEAVDLEIPGVSNLELAVYIRDNLVFDQLILEYPVKDDPNAGWVHCSLTARESSRARERSWGASEGRDNRGQVMTRTRAGYRAGLQG